MNCSAEFSFDLNLFDMRNPAVPYLVLAFAQLAREGLGPRRGRADLNSMFSPIGDIVFCRARLPDEKGTEIFWWRRTTSALGKSFPLLLA